MKRHTLLDEMACNPLVFDAAIAGALDNGPDRARPVFHLAGDGDANSDMRRRGDAILNQYFDGQMDRASAKAQLLAVGYAEADAVRELNRVEKAYNGPDWQGPETWYR